MSSSTASHSVLAYATVRGLICGWDRRIPRTIWKLQNDPALGKFVRLNWTLWHCILNIRKFWREFGKQPSGNIKGNLPDELRLLFKLCVSLKNCIFFLGLITSFVVDPSQCWLTVGTSNGELVCWDMRFQLPVAQLTHPRGKTFSDVLYYSSRFVSLHWCSDCYVVWTSIGGWSPQQSLFPHLLTLR